MDASATDADLVGASLAGEVEAFGRLVQRYQDLVCAISFCATGDSALSEDVAQETFVAAWHRLDDLREPSKLRAWLAQIARNLSAKALRRVGREIPSDPDATPALRDAEAEGPTPLDAAIDKESEQVVWSALQHIPATYREPMVLFYRSGRSAKQVADALGVSEDAVNQRLSRGRQYLKQSVAHLVESTLERTGPSGAVAAGVIAAIAVTAAAGSAGASSAAGASAKGTLTMKASLEIAVAAAILAALIIAGVVWLDPGEPASASANSTSTAPASSPTAVPPGGASDQPGRSNIASGGDRASQQPGETTPKTTINIVPPSSGDHGDTVMAFRFHVPDDDGSLWYKLHPVMPSCSQGLLESTAAKEFRIELGFEAAGDESRLVSATVLDGSGVTSASHAFSDCLLQGLGDERFPGALEEAVVEFSLDPRQPGEPVDKEMLRSLPIKVGPSRGPDTAPVSVVVYTDFQCLYCANVLTTLDQLRDEYESEVRVVTKLFPLKPSSRRLAQATVAAHEQGKFWEMHDLIFANQDAGNLGDDELLAFAEQLDLDTEKFRADLNSETVAEIVEADLDEGRALGVRGTPTLFVNENRVVGARPIDEFRSLIDAELVN